MAKPKTTEDRISLILVGPGNSKNAVPSSQYIEFLLGCTVALMRIIKLNETYLSVEVLSVVRPERKCCIEAYTFLCITKLRGSWNEGVTIYVTSLRDAGAENPVFKLVELGSNSDPEIQ